MTAISDEALAELKVGLEGVTTGPWEYDPKHAMFVGYRHAVHIRGHGTLIVGLEHDKQSAKDAAHIARCDPQTIGGLIKRLEEAEARAKRWDEEGWQDLDVIKAERDTLRAQVAQLRKALEPFALSPIDLGTLALPTPQGAPIRRRLRKHRLRHRREEEDMTHDELVEGLNRYLTEHFIWPDTADVPSDDCEKEARAILAFIAGATKEATERQLQAAFRLWNSPEGELSGKNYWSAMHAASPLWPNT